MHPFHIPATLCSFTHTKKKEKKNHHISVAPICLCPRAVIAGVFLGPVAFVAGVVFNFRLMGYGAAGGYTDSGGRTATRGRQRNGDGYIGLCIACAILPLFFVRGRGCFYFFFLSGCVCRARVRKDTKGILVCVHGGGNANFKRSDACVLCRCLTKGCIIIHGRVFGREKSCYIGKHS